MKIKVSFEKIVIVCLLVFATGIYLLLIWAIKAILGIFGIDSETISLLGLAFFVPFLFLSIFISCCFNNNTIKFAINTS